MTVRRVVMGVVGAASVVTGLGMAQAAPVSVHPQSVQVSRGSATIVQTRVSDQEYDYQVAFTGPLAIHGWTHTGTLRGSSTAYLWEAFAGTIPDFPVATGDGVVTGDCAGGPDDPVDSNTGVGVSDLANVHGYSFGCDLGHNGGPRWHVNISTSLKEQVVGPKTTRFSGTYRVIDVQSSLVGIQQNVTYGDFQLTTYTDDGGGVQWGPFLFSGQMMIGSTRYDGDLVSDVGPYVYSLPMPEMTVSGSSHGLHVTGQCSGAYDPVFSQVRNTYDFTCRLQVNAGALVTVPLRGFVTGGGGRCVSQQCWNDEDGYVVDG
jgi:hypothetical protein